ncbi:MAG: COG2958 family protein [Cellulosilyticaceae bacterium]
MIYTFDNLIVDTLKQVARPLSAKEIWDHAVKLSIADKIVTKGKTPWQTLAAKIYIDMKQNKDSQYIKVGTAPTRFYLKDTWHGALEGVADTAAESVSTDQVIKASFHERDLHPLLVKAVYSHPHFKCNVKTIFHEVSKKSKKGYNRWLHPDLVGIYFPFDDYTKHTLQLQETFKINPYKIFSFEMKINLTMANVREYYFQAVSNSSWANEGYLVALEVEDDADFMAELSRLTAAFGIGIVKLDAINIEQSEILFPAKERTYLDWNTINRLAEENKDFEDFTESLVEDIKLGKVKSSYDTVLNDEDYLEYINNKKIADKQNS